MEHRFCFRLGGILARLSSPLWSTPVRARRTKCQVISLTLFASSTRFRTGRTPWPPWPPRMRMGRQRTWHSVGLLWRIGAGDRVSWRGYDGGLDQALTFVRRPVSEATTVAGRRRVAVFPSRLLLHVWVGFGASEGSVSEVRASRGVCRVVPILAETWGWFMGGHTRLAWWPGTPARWDDGSLREQPSSRPMRVTTH